MAPGEQRLIAYFVASTPPVSPNVLRQQLARLLPDYMVPSFFVALDAIPLTPNGKTDRLRLPLPTPRRSDPDARSRGSDSTIESELAAIWAEILGVPDVKPDESFLDLGGDSLKAFRITARIAMRFKLEIPVSVLLESGTVAQVAKALTAAREGHTHAMFIDAPDVRAPHG